MQRVLNNFRTTFAVFVVIGGAIILAFPKQSVPGTGNAHWIMVSLVVGLMAIFGVIVWIRSCGNYDSDVDAESFYYLGFIYTLITLVATFTPLLVVGEKPSSQLVLGLFGLGLITTFVGLAGRVFFLQPRSMSSTDDGARRLGQAYSQAARDIEATSIQMKRLAIELQEIARQSHAGLSASLVQANTQIVEFSAGLLERSTARVAGTLSESTKSIAEMVERTATSVTAALDNIGVKLLALKLPPEELGVRLEERLEILIAATARASDAAIAFERDVAPLRKEFIGATAEVSSASSNLAAFSRVTLEISSALSQTQSALESLRIRAESLEQNVDSASGSTAKLSAAAQGLGIQLSHANDNAAGFAAAMSTLVRQAGSAAPALESFRVRVEDLRERLTGVIVAITSANKLATDITQTQLQTSSELVRGVEVLKSHQVRVEELSRELERDLEASEKALRKVHENLVKATEFVVSRVE